MYMFFPVDNLMWLLYDLIEGLAPNNVIKGQMHEFLLNIGPTYFLIPSLRYDLQSTITVLL